MSAPSPTVAAAWTCGPKMPPIREHKKMRPRNRKNERRFWGIRETILSLSIPDDWTREGGGWGGGRARGRTGRGDTADVATRRSGFRGGWELCLVVRNWATLCMSGSLPGLGRSKPIWYKAFVFIVLGAILRVPDQVSRVFERSRADESSLRFEW